MYSFEAIEDGILRHLYDLGGWERQPSLDENAVDGLYRAKLVELPQFPIV